MSGGPTDPQFWRDVPLATAVALLWAAIYFLWDRIKSNATRIDQHVKWTTDKHDDLARDLRPDITRAHGRLDAHGLALSEMGGKISVIERDLDRLQATIRHEFEKVERSQAKTNESITNLDKKIDVLIAKLAGRQDL